MKKRKMLEKIQVKKILQESQFSIELVVDVSRKSSGRNKNVKNRNCKKGSREKAHLDTLHHMLTHDYYKVGMEDYGSDRSFFSVTTSRIVKIECNVSLNGVPEKYK